METVTLTAVLQQLGPGGLAALAVYYLMGQHKTQIDKIVDGHTKGMIALADQLKTMDDRNDVRESKKIEVLQGMRDQIADNTRRLDGIERGLEEVDIKPKFRP